MKADKQAETGKRTIYGSSSRFVWRVTKKEMRRKKQKKRTKSVGAVSARERKTTLKNLQKRTRYRKCGVPVTQTTDKTVVNEAKTKALVSPYPRGNLRTAA